MAENKRKKSANRGRPIPPPRRTEHWQGNPRTTRLSTPAKPQSARGHEIRNLRRRGRKRPPVRTKSRERAGPHFHTAPKPGQYLRVLIHDGSEVTGRRRFQAQLERQCKSSGGKPEYGKPVRIAALLQRRAPQQLFRTHHAPRVIGIAERRDRLQITRGRSIAGIPLQKFNCLLKRRIQLRVIAKAGRRTECGKQGKNGNGN